MRGEGPVNFHIEYQNERGSISRYYPDFLLKLADGKTIYVVETKGRMDLNNRRKIIRLIHWYDNVNQLQNDYRYETLFVSLDDRVRHANRARSFQDMIEVYEAQTKALVKGHGNVE